MDQDIDYAFQVRTSMADPRGSCHQVHNFSKFVALKSLTYVHYMLNCIESFLNIPVSGMNGSWSWNSLLFKDAQPYDNILLIIALIAQPFINVIFVLEIV